MSVFEMEFELTGLKIKIKSEQGQVPEAVDSVQQHIGKLLQSAAALGTGQTQAKGQDSATNANGVRTIEALPLGEAPNPIRSRTTTRKRGAASVNVPSLEFSHDAAGYGSPRQTWNTAQKAMWLLYIIEKQSNVKELNRATIVATFNKLFKEFGPITTTNVTRDLGRARVKHNYVSSDASKEPQTWYLLEAGKQEVQKLLQDVRA